MEKVTVHRAGSVEATSFRGESPGLVFKGEYDLAFVVPSWDSRAASIVSAAELRADHAIVVRFDEEDEGGLRRASEVALGDYCETISSRMSELRGSVTAVEAVWDQISRVLVVEYLRKRRALRVFVDSTTCPRYHMLGMLGEGVGRGLIRSLSVGYTEGKYPPGEGATEISFTGGHWRTIPVPGLLGSEDPSKKRFYLVSIGFEGWKTLRVISRADPTRVSLLLPDPGTQPDYAARTIADNQQLIAEYCIPEEQVVRALAGDAVGAWKQLTDAAIDRPETENSFYLCSGPKAHALALGLRALEIRKPSVLYNVPEEHRVVEVVPSGVFWRYDIEGVTTPY